MHMGIITDHVRRKEMISEVSARLFTRVGAFCPGPVREWRWGGVRGYILPGGGTTPRLPPGWQAYKSSLPTPML